MVARLLEQVVQKSCGCPIITGSVQSWFGWDFEPLDLVKDALVHGSGIRIDDPFPSKPFYNSMPFLINCS